MDSVSFLADIFIFLNLLVPVRNEIFFSGYMWGQSKQIMVFLKRNYSELQGGTRNVSCMKAVVCLSQLSGM